MRKRRRALLPHRDIPDRHWLLHLRPGLQCPRNHHQRTNVPGLWQGRRPVLLGEHLHRCRRAVPVRQLDGLLHVQTVRSNRANLLFDLVVDIDHDGLQGSGHRMRQQHQYLQGVWSGRRAVLHREHVQGRWHGLQEFLVPGLWRGRGDVLQRQHLHRWLLCHALRRNVVWWWPDLPGSRRGLRQLLLHHHRQPHL